MEQDNPSAADAPSEPNPASSQSPTSLHRAGGGGSGNGPPPPLLAETPAPSPDSSASPPLMPYASHAATGSGKTPIGILLFAASHLLLGAALGLLVILMWRAIPRKSELTELPAAMLFLGLIAATATFMLAGSVML